MDDPLVASVPPHKLILRSVPDQQLKMAVLQANTFNRKYWLEVAHVWMCSALQKVEPATGPIPTVDDTEEYRLTDAMLACLDKNNIVHVEAFVAEQSYRLIDSFSLEWLEPAGQAATDFLKGLLERIAEHCSFEKNNDSYLHAVIKTKIPFRKTVLLEPPFQAINHYFHDQANAIVRPLMVRDGKATYDAVNLSQKTPDSLASAIALLSEALDGKVPQLAVNTGIHRHELVPFALVGSACKWGDQLGLRDGTKLLIPEEQDLFPVTTIVYHWAKRGYPALFTALTIPHTLQPGSGLYRFVH